MKEESNFIVETEGHCFFCLNKIPATFPSPKLVPEIGIPKSSIYSLQYFSRYLKMDMTRVFSTNELISPELLAKVERAKLKVELCEECASQSERFSELCRQLEKIEMEIGFCMMVIHGKLVTAKTDQLSRSAKADLTDKLSGKLEIVNTLRNEAAKKCSVKLGDKMGPRVQLQNKTKRQLNLERVKIKVRRRRNSFNNTRKCFSSSNPAESPDWKAEFDVKLGPSPRSPSNSFPNDDSSDDEFYSDADSKLDPDSTTSSQTLDVDQKMAIVAPSKILNQVEAPPSILNPETGKHKCEICLKEFSQHNHFLRHYKAVHLKIRYKCSFCSKEFTQQDNHRRHLKSEHLGVLFKCIFCSETFKHKTVLQNHLKRTTCGRPSPGHVEGTAF